MAAAEVIAIDDNEDEEIEIIFADPQPLSKVEQIRQQIELLQAFCNSSEPVPLEYNQFYKCAKKVCSSFGDATILAAWKRAVTNQVKDVIVRGKTNTLSHRKKHVNMPLVVDLTEANTEDRSPIPLEQPMPQSSKLPVLEIEPTSQAVPVALFASPHYPQSNTDLLKPLTGSNQTGGKSITNIDVALVNKLEDVTNCLVKIVNDSLEDSEASNKGCILEAEPDYGNVPMEILGSESCLFNQTKFNKSTNSLAYSENSAQYKDIDSQSTKNDNELNESDHSNVTKKKRKNKFTHDICIPKIKNICPAVKSSSDKISKQDHSQKKRKLKNIISMTDAELKLFREEQKRQKLREKKDLLTIQLERVHDRLVDVLIPKYFNSSSKNS